MDNEKINKHKEGGSHQVSSVECWSVAAMFPFPVTIGLAAG